LPVSTMSEIVAATNTALLPDWALLLLSALAGACVAAIGAFVINRVRMHGGHMFGGGRVHDSVTGAGSRNAFMHRLDSEWRMMQRGSGADFGILVIDVDAFGDINDLYGRETGDLVLREIADRIKLRVRPDDFVARIEADEFAVICSHTGREELLSLRRGLEAYVNYARSAPVMLSIGTAYWRPGDDSSEDMLRRARRSMLERRDERPMRYVEDALAELLKT
jgi:diguanylate cyclase (GGDEF)-like protein